jgi:dipeptidyl aminopeptidase/acylaminoacyl peptidase
MLLALGAGALLAQPRRTADGPLSGPVKLPETRIPEVKIHPGQPTLPDLRNTAGEEHGPTYKAPTDRFVGLFTPFRTDRAALSPDGKYLAYTLRDETNVSVVIVEIDHPEKVTARVTVATDETSTPMLSQNQEEKTPAQVRWLRWTSPTRLVVETNAAFAIGSGSTWQTRTGAIYGMDANGGNARLLASPRDVQETLPNESTLEVRSPDIKPIWSADQPIPSNAPTNGDDPDDPAVAAAPNLPDQIVTSVAQDVRIFDLDSHNPGSVILQTFGNARSSGARMIGFVRLDTMTAKLTELTADLVPGLSQGLTDRAGHVRLWVPVTLLAAFPHQYQYLGQDGSSRPKALDSIVGLSGTAGFSLSPVNFFGSRAIPLGFDEDPNVLYYAANLQRDTFGIYSVDLTTGKRGAIQFENPAYDLAPPIDVFDSGRTLVFDRYFHRLAGIRFTAATSTTAWIYPSFQNVQKSIEHALPGRSVDIIEWDQTGNRYLALASAPGDAGAFYVFDRTTGRLAEFVRRSPWIDAAQTHQTFAIATKTAGGLPLTGLMTVPRNPRIKPMPLMVLCPTMPWRRVTPDFSDRVQALADMGFMVVEFNGRGTWGFGMKYREALAPGYDLTQVEDLMTMLDYVTHNFTVDPKRVAVMGEVHGGFIALRALQMHPDRLRCAVAINAPTDLGAWLDEQRWTEGNAGPALTRNALGDSVRLKEAPLARHPEQITKPVFILHYGGADGTPRTSTYLAAKNLFATVNRRTEGSEFADLTTDYVRALPKARSDTYQQIEAFLNATVYDYKVKMGDAKVQPDRPGKH